MPGACEKLNMVLFISMDRANIHHVQPKVIRFVAKHGDRCSSIEDILPFRMSSSTSEISWRNAFARL